MSVAEALARARAVSAPPAKVHAVPSLLHDSPSAAAAISRSELAGLALNGLEALSAVDPVLTKLHAPLLLLDPRQDRATLSPPQAAELSTAVVTLATRLAPVFPLRHSQKALEWVVRGLNVSTLGTDSEVNAILLAALPFHTTPTFTKLARAVLMHGPKRQMWTWLEPVVKQNKPPALSFLISNIPPTVLHAALDLAAVTVKSGVSAVALSGFLINVVGRRLASKSAPPVERRILLLRLLDTVESVRKEKSPSKRKAQSDVLCALFASAAAAVPIGIEADVATAAAQAACTILLKVQRKSHVSDTVLAFLGLLIARGGVKLLPTSSAGNLISSKTLPGVLPRLGNPALAETMYHVCVMSILPNDHLTPKHMGNIETALSIDTPELLSDRTVAAAVTALLNVISAPLRNAEGEGRAGALKKETEDMLISIVAKLARGRNASGVDEGLRNHFNSRKRKKQNASRYAEADAILLKALSGTSFQVLKARSVGYRGMPSTDTLIGILSHPEPAVRRRILDKLVREDILTSQDNAAHKKQITEKLLLLFRDESDSTIASLALQCLLKLRECCDIEDVLRSVIKRFRAGYAKWNRKKKKSAVLSSLQSIATHLVALCEQLLGKKQLEAQAALVGLITEGTLSPENGFRDAYEKAAQILMRAKLDFSLVETSQNDEKKQCSPAAVKAAIMAQVGRESWNCLTFLQALSSWEPEWAIRMLQLWLSHLAPLSTGAKKPVAVRNIIECLTWIHSEGGAYRAQVPRLVIDGLPTLHILADSTASQRQILDVLWKFCAIDGASNVSSSFLKKALECVGIDETLDMLQRAVCKPLNEESTIQIDTLRWYLNTCNSSKLRQRHPEAVLVIFNAFYGSRSSLREEVRRLANARKLAPVVKKRKRTVIDQVLAMIGTTPLPVKSDQKITLRRKKDWTEQLRSFVLEEQIRQGYPPPILESVDGVEFVLERITGGDNALHERVILLRGFQDLRDMETAARADLWLVLKELLEMVTDSGEKQSVIIECLARITILIADLRPSQQLPSCLQIVKSLAISRLRLAQSLESTNHQFISKLQLAVVGAASAAVALQAQTRAASFDDATAELIGYLLWYSTNSSPAGDCARGILDTVKMDDLIDGIKPCMAKGVQRLSSDCGGKVDSSEGPLSQSEGFARGAWLGAVELLRRRILAHSEYENDSLTAEVEHIVPFLWEFMTLTATKSGATASVLAEELEYELFLVMDVLSVLYEKGGSLQRSNAELKSVVDGVFYPGVSYAGRDSASASAVRSASLKLLGRLVPKNGKSILSMLEIEIQKLLESRRRPNAIQSLCRVVPVLLRSGCIFQNISQWLVSVIYRAESHAEASEAEREAVVSCCRLLPSAKDAVSVYIHEMSRYAAEHFSASFLGKECSLMLLSANLDAIADMGVLSSCPKSILGEVVNAHLLHPTFIAKLMLTADEGQDNDVALAFRKVFSALLSLDDNLIHKDATSTLVALLPLPVLAECTVATLLDENATVRQRGLRVIAERLDAEDIPLLSSWNLTADFVGRAARHEENAQLAFIRALAQPLGDLIQSGRKESNRSTEVQLAIACMEKITKRMGSAALRVLLEFSPVLIDILEDKCFDKALSDPEPRFDYCNEVSEALLCLSSFITTLRKHAITFLPLTLNKSMAILNAVFGLEASGEGVAGRTSAALVTMAQAAIRVCTTILETNSKFFGRVTLQALMTLTLTHNADVLIDLLSHAVQKVPSSVFVAAVNGVTNKLATVHASLQGVEVFLKSIEAGVKVMRKSELKLQTEQIVPASLRCLQYQRSHSEEQSNGVEASYGQPDELNVPTPTELAAWRCVDEQCARTLTTLVLRLSESEFQPVFKAIVRWFEGGRLGAGFSAAAQSSNQEVPRNILRAVPFYRLSLLLFQTLQSLYAPYFFQLLDPVLEVVGSKKVSSAPHLQQMNGLKNPKKRNRSDLRTEHNEIAVLRLAKLHSELRDLCLDNVTHLLRQDLDGNILTPAVVSKMQGSLVNAFDEANGKSERVMKALDALCARIVAVGSTNDSREESRDLVKALSREVLLRTRSDDAVLREASLLCCKSMASTVGDEFLVTLPETMPILSEVIDDEDTGVQRAAKAFAQVLEDLAGEPILSQLK